MTNRSNKIKTLPSREEVYKYGYRKGYGYATGRCIGFLRGKHFSIHEFKEFMLGSKCPIPRSSPDDKQAVETRTP